MTPDRRPDMATCRRLPSGTAGERRSTDVRTPVRPAGYRGPRGSGRRRRGRARRPGRRRAPGGRRARRDGARAGRGDRRQAGAVRPRRVRASTPGPSLLTLPPVYRDLFAATGGAARGRRRPGPRSTRPCALPLRRRHRLDVPGDARARLPRRARRRPRRRAPARSGRRCSTRGGRMWQTTRGAFPHRPAPRRRDACRGWPASPATSRTDRARGGRLRGLGARLPARTRGCGCCSTATPPTPAPTRAAPRPRWPPCPTSSRRSAPGTSRGGLHRLAATPLAERAPSCGRRRPHRLPTCAGSSSRAAGPSRRPARRTASGSPPTSSSSDADAAARLPRPAARPPGARGRAPAARGATPSLSGFVLLLALRGPHPGPGAPHRALPRPTTTPSSTRSSAPADRGARPVRRPDRLRQRARRPGAAARRRLRGVVRAGQRPAARPGAGGRRLARTRAWPSATPTGVLDVLAERGLDVRDRVLWREVRTPADLERRHRRRGGSIYGTSSNGARAAFLRPANARRSRACSSSAGPPTPAAACRWSPCPPRSSPAWSVRPDALSASRCKAPPVHPEPPASGPELQALTGFLDQQRQTILRKADGLTREQLAQPLPPSSLTLAGLVNHLALVEDTWFRVRFAGLGTTRCGLTTTGLPTGTWSSQRRSSSTGTSCCRLPRRLRTEPRRRGAGREPGSAVGRDVARRIALGPALGAAAHARGDREARRPCRPPARGDRRHRRRLTTRDWRGRDFRLVLRRP